MPSLNAHSIKSSRRSSTLSSHSSGVELPPTNTVEGCYAFLNHATKYLSQCQAMVRYLLSLLKVDFVPASWDDVEVLVEQMQSTTKSRKTKKASRVSSHVSDIELPAGNTVEGCNEFLRHVKKDILYCQKMVRYLLGKYLKNKPAPVKWNDVEKYIITELGFKPETMSIRSSEVYFEAESNMSRRVSSKSKRSKSMSRKTKKGEKRKTV
jgi:hypothetical protein